MNVSLRIPRPGEGEELEQGLAQDRNAEAELAHRDEPVASEPLQYVGTKKELEMLGPEYGEKKLIRQISTVSTSMSVTTNGEKQDAKDVAVQKSPWYHKVNPFRIGKIPPIPEERRISREYGANFFSLLLFQWINPIMTV